MQHIVDHCSTAILRRTIPRSAFQGLQSRWLVSADVLAISDSHLDRESGRSKCRGRFRGVTSFRRPVAVTAGQAARLELLRGEQEDGSSEVFVVRTAASRS
jgi:hypothetical protein